MSHLNSRYNTTTILARRWYASVYTPGVATNYATHILYNAATISKMLVVRGVLFSGGSATTRPRIGVRTGTLGTNVGLVTPLWAGEPAPNGQHFYVDNAAQLADQIPQPASASQTYGGPQQLPMCILSPGWAMYAQNGVVAGTVIAGFWWEELDIGDPQLGSLEANW